MTRAFLIAATLLAVTAAIPQPADARNRDRHHDGWGNDWENRRDARRAGVVAGVVTAGVVSAAASNNVQNRYAECLMATGYDYACERQRYYDEQDARRNVRRSAVVAGVATRAIVRD